MTLTGTALACWDNLYNKIPVGDPLDFRVHIDQFIHSFCMPSSRAQQISYVRLLKKSRSDDVAFFKIAQETLLDFATWMPGDEEIPNEAECKRIFLMPCLLNGVKILPRLEMMLQQNLLVKLNNTCISRNVIVFLIMMGKLHSPKIKITTMANLTTTTIITIIKNVCMKILPMEKAKSILKRAMTMIAPRTIKTPRTIKRAHALLMMPLVLFI